MSVGGLQAVSVAERGAEVGGVEPWRRGRRAVGGDRRRGERRRRPPTWCLWPR